MDIAARQSSLGSLVREQVRIISALVLREIYTRFGRENIGFAWIVAEPAAFATSVICLWSLMKHSGHADVPITPFVLTGYMPLLMYRHMTGRLMRCMQANTALLYHRQVTIIALYIARIVVEMLGTSAAFAFCLGVFGLLGYVDMPYSIPQMIGGWLLYAWYAAATSIAVGALSERSEVVDKFWNPVSYIMIPLSGTFFMAAWIPDPFRGYLLYSPPLNGVEIIRGGYFGPGVPTYFDATYFAYVNAVITVIGLYLAKDARRYIEVE